jgi:hypothetical protein
VGPNTFTVRATDVAGNVTTASQTITRQFLPPGAMSLVEGPNFVTQASVPVDLTHPAQGTRTIRFDLNALFDTADRSAAVEDTFLAYLVDPANPSQTILDRGQPGTALFALAGGRAEFNPGQVRFDGSTVEIDVTGVTGRTAGQLVFQLINSDSDNGTIVHVLRVVNTVDPQGIPSPTFIPQSANRATAGPAVNLAQLTAAPAVKAVVSNVRFDPANGRYTADLQVRNDGPALGRQVAVTFPGLPAGVFLVNPSGFDATGAPYLNLTNAIRPGGLAAGATTDPIEIVFTDPNRVRFALRPTVRVGPPNRPPVFEAIGPLTVRPGGRLEVALRATDPDGSSAHTR